MDKIVESHATLTTPAYAAKAAKSAWPPGRWSDASQVRTMFSSTFSIAASATPTFIKRVTNGATLPSPWFRATRSSARSSWLGPKVKKWKVGQTVGVGCFVDSDRTCEACKAGEEQYCESGPTLTYNGFERDGKTPTYGGYSTRIVVDENYVLSIPKGIPLDRAAPLLCAGITTYSPLKHFGLKKGDKLAVVGLGGLGHMGVKFGHAMGAHVTVLSHSPGKRADALKLGADDFIATKDEAYSRRMPAASTSSSTRCRQITTITPTSICFAAMGPWCS